MCEELPARDDETEGTVFLNALSATMPMCDLADQQRMRTPDELSNERRCYVYCAQRSCHAAVDFMKEHADVLSEQCNELIYLRNGALSMPAERLRDGVSCHSSILEHNPPGDEPCLTCGQRTEPLAVALDGVSQPEARYTTTHGDIPDWYYRVDMSSVLPRFFHCDEKFRQHPPVPYAATQEPDAVDVTMAVPPGMSEERPLYLAYWAATPSDAVREAHVAYGDFSNRGIMRCDDVCRFRMEPPGAYTAEGKTYEPHVHVSEWLGDHWSRTVGTVTFPHSRA